MRIPTDFTIYPDSQLGIKPYDVTNYHYILNNHQACTNSVFLLVMVKTQPKHFEQRKAIRESWGKLSNWGETGQKMLVMFMLGIDPKIDNSDVIEESRRYGDIIQDSFVESFYNLTVKLVSQYKWTVKYCPQARYFMTTDDDMFIHTLNIIKFLENEYGDEGRGVFVGHLHSGSPPYRDSSIKYSVPFSIYRGLYYPDYCAGAGYILSMDVVRLLFLQSTNLPLIYIDDVYSGLLGRAAGILPTHDPRFFGEMKIVNDSCLFDHFFTSHGYSPDQITEMFSHVLKGATSGRFCWAKL